MTATPPPVHGRSSGPGHLRLVRPSDWTLWRRPPRVLRYILAVDAAAVAMTIATILIVPIQGSDLTLGLTLAACALVYIEASAPVERIRERVSSTPHINLNTTWTFAACVLLHPAIVTAIIIVIFIHRWVRVRHRVVHKHTFSAAATIVASYAGIAVLAATGNYTSSPTSHET